MRRSAHSQEFWRYRITSTGAEIEDALADFDGILSGNPMRRAGTPLDEGPGPTR